MNRRIAFRALATLMGAALAVGCAHGRASLPASVERAASDSYLRFLLADGVFSSGEIDVARNALGIERTCALVRPAFEAVMRDFSPAWHRIFATLEAGAGSPGALGEGNNGEATMLQRQFLIALGLKHSEMLEQHASRIRDAALVHALKIPDDAIDYQARERETATARENGSLLCGLTEGPRN